MGSTWPSRGTCGTPCGRLGCLWLLFRRLWAPIGCPLRSFWTSWATCGVPLGTLDCLWPSSRLNRKWDEQMCVCVLFCCPLCSVFNPQPWHSSVLQESSGRKGELGSRKIENGPKAISKSPFAISKAPANFADRFHLMSCIISEEQSFIQAMKTKMLGVYGSCTHNQCYVRLHPDGRADIMISWSRHGGGVPPPHSNPIAATFPREGSTSPRQQILLLRGGG